MSGGEQQMLAIGRALMAKPKLLLLDEPSMGIAPILVDRIYETIAEINRQGTTILLVEQNANYALGVSQRGYVLETGKVALTDASDALRTNPDVHEGVPRRMTVLLPIANVGVLALYLLFIWLASAIVGAYLSVAQGLRREGGAGVGAAAQRRRRARLAGDPGQGRLGLARRRAVSLAARRGLTPPGEQARRPRYFSVLRSASSRSGCWNS